MAASRRPPHAPDEPTHTDARALEAPKEASAGRGKKLRPNLPREPSGRHHLVSEATASGKGLALREADAAPVKPHARHEVPSEVTAGRGVALKFSSPDDVTAKGAAVREGPGEADALAARTAEALGQATAAASRPSGKRRADTQDETRPEGRDVGDSGAPSGNEAGAATSGAAPDARAGGSAAAKSGARVGVSSAAKSGDAPDARVGVSSAAKSGARVGVSSAAKSSDAPDARVGVSGVATPGDASNAPVGVSSATRSGARASVSSDASAASTQDEAAHGLDVDGLADAEDALDDVDDEPPGAPPEADAVATRALAVAALVQRGFHEARPSNASEVRQLQGWVDAFGLFAGFGAGAIELFDAKHGAWTPEDRAAVGWLGEELRLLLWALRLEPALPSTFERSDAKALVKQVPLLEPPQGFVAKAKARDVDELEVMRAFYEVVYEAARCELWARGILEDPSLAETDDDELEALLDAAAADGFDRAAVTKAQGVAAAAVAGLRACARSLLTDLFVSGSPHAALAFDPGALEAMSDTALANAFAIARTRSGALEWLTEGEAWDFGDDDDDFGADDEG